jgi:RND family efflux transporter MFP subunit
MAIVLVTVMAWSWVRGRRGNDNGAETQLVRKGRLLVTITADGSLESANNCELKCQIPGGGRIISIIPDGTEVEKGTELVQLDRSLFEEQLNAQKIIYERAVAVKIQAEQDFEASTVAVQEYIQGTYHKDLQAAAALITVARQNLNTSENALVHTERMYRKGFVTALQLEADTFAVERAHLDLDAAVTAKKVIEQFTKPKTLTGLEAVRDAADARRRSEEASVSVEKAKLDRIQEQLKFCVIRAPQHGMVIYANNIEQQRGNSDAPQIEEGAMVRDRQTIIRLPDLNKMQVRTSVHESRVPHLRSGMPVRITVLDRVLKGHVNSIANRPAPSARYQAQSKNYNVFITVDGSATGLKPGMSATVEILLADLHDVYTIPVAAVVEQDRNYYAWVLQSNGPQRRAVSIGPTDDKVIEIKDGVAAGDEVIVNPRACVEEARDFDDSDLSSRRMTEENAWLRPPGPATAVSATTGSPDLSNHSH